MIQIKFVGGAKKSFATESLNIDESDIQLDKLLSLILQKKPASSPEFDITNILIAVNGVDSSALQGRSTILKENDIVSIIPVIHGGSPKRLMLTILNNRIQVTEVRGKRLHNVTLLETLRKDFAKTKLQAVSSKFILNRRHLEKVILLSLNSKKKNRLLSNKLETDLLMRFAISGQISNAINSAGLVPGQNFLLIAIGSTRDLDGIYERMADDIVPLFSKDHSVFLRRHFGITKRHQDTVLSRDPLADILVEKAATLFG